MQKNNNKLDYKIIGIDLAGKSKNPSGICFLNSDTLNCCTVYEDKEILNLISSTKPSLIAIDAPLSLPKGRCCLSNRCNCSKKGGHFRKAELEMRKYGRTLPLTFHGMRMLTERGIRITDNLKKKYDVIESHPRTIQKILGLQNEEPHEFLDLPQNINEHELDATLLVIAGIFYLKGNFMEFGDEEEGIIILPKKD